MDLRTGPAFWPRKNGLIAVYPPLERDERCDVAVIGAGITGALVAHRLTEDNCDVVLLDRDDVGMGSTAACTGLLQYETDTSLGELAAQLGVERAVRSWRLGLKAIDDIETLCLPIDCGFASRPSVYLASTRWDVRRLKAEHALRAAMALMSPGWTGRKSPPRSASSTTARFGVAATQRSMPTSSHTKCSVKPPVAARACTTARSDQSRDDGRRHAQHEPRPNGAGETHGGGRRLRGRTPAPPGPRPSAQHLGVCQRAVPRPVMVAGSVPDLGNAAALSVSADDERRTGDGGRRRRTVVLSPREYRLLARKPSGC